MTTLNCEAGAQAPWLDEAWRLFGVHERQGSADHPEIMSLYREVGHPGIRHDETPWCAAFLGACLERAGFRSTRSLMARSYSQWGVRLSQPRPGAIIVLSRGADPVYGHVGFWVGQTASRIFLLGGNQSNAVTVSSFDKRRLIDVRWPNANVDSPQPSQNFSKPQPDFQNCLSHVLEMEGGYSNDPYDPGGPTNFGITLKVYASWLNTPLTAVTQASLTERLKKIPASDVAAIYQKNYWQRASCEDFSSGLALMHFDCAVNQGVSRAIRFLQQAVGTDVDGEIGPMTRAAAAKMPVDRVLEAYAEIRRKHYRSLHHFWRFGRGWLRRVSRTLIRATHMADAALDETDTTREKKELHETNSDTHEKEISMPTKSIMPGKAKWWGHSMTIWGVVVTTLSTVLPTLGPIIGVDITPDLVEDAGQQLVTTVQAISGLIGTLMTIYGRARATKPLAQRSVNLHI